MKILVSVLLITAAVPWLMTGRLGTTGRSRKGGLDLHGIGCRRNRDSDEICPSLGTRGNPCEDSPLQSDDQPLRSLHLEAHNKDRFPSINAFPSATPRRSALIKLNPPRTIDGTSLVTKAMPTGPMSRGLGMATIRVNGTPGRVLSGRGKRLRLRYRERTGASHPGPLWFARLPGRPFWRTSSPASPKTGPHLMCPAGRHPIPLGWRRGQGP